LSPLARGKLSVIAAVAAVELSLSDAEGQSGSDRFEEAFALRLVDDRAQPDRLSAETSMKPSGAR
jgi:hypothetical protein